MSDPNNAFGNPQPTHINAYHADLAEAEQTLAAAQGRVNSLKATIKDMEGQSANVTSADIPAAPAEVPVDAPVDNADEPAPKQESLGGRIKDKLLGKDKPAPEEPEAPADNPANEVPEAPAEEAAEPVAAEGDEPAAPSAPVEPAPNTDAKV